MCREFSLTNKYSSLLYKSLLSKPITDSNQSNVTISTESIEGENKEISYLIRNIIYISTRSVDHKIQTMVMVNFTFLEKALICTYLIAPIRTKQAVEYKRRTKCLRINRILRHNRGTISFERPFIVRQIIV